MGLGVGFVMRRFSGAVGVQQGTRILFSDFAHDGAMWTGSGPREVRQTQPFSEPFQSPPVVSVGISMWDIDQKTNSRVDVSAENVTASGFDIVFRTWADTRIARIRADWIAIGQARDEGDWDVR
ncbi:MAG: H-type lectin domain-containing protein [Tabrizicola sp.]